MSTLQRPRSLIEDRLPLKHALKYGDLAAFVALAEAEGCGAADGQAFQRALTAIAKPKRSRRLALRLQAGIDGGEGAAADSGGPSLGADPPRPASV